MSETKEKIKEKAECGIKKSLDANKNMRSQVFDKIKNCFEFYNYDNLETLCNQMINLEKKRKVLIEIKYFINELT